MEFPYIEIICGECFLQKKKKCHFMRKSVKNK